MSESTPASQPDTPSQPASATKGRRLLVPVVAIAAFAVCLVIVVLVVVLALRPHLIPSSTGGIPLEITRISNASPLPTPVSISPPVIDVGGDAVSLAIPVALDVGEVSFAVHPTDPDGGTWGGS